MLLRSDHQLVDHAVDAWRSPRCHFHDLLFHQGIDGSREGDAPWSTCTPIAEASKWARRCRAASILVRISVGFAWGPISILLITPQTPRRSRTQVSAARRA